MGVAFIEPRRDDARLLKPRRYKMLIGGKSVDARSGETFKRESPVWPGVTVGEWPKAGAADVEAAIAAARTAFDDGPWPRMPGAERAKIVARIGDLLLEHREEFATIESLEIGKTIAGTRGEVGYAADCWSFAAGASRCLEGSTHDQYGPNALGIVLREPIGVVGVITPWNYPLIIACERLSWALATGCTVVVKPSEFTSGATIRLAELAREAGMPDGVFNVVTGLGDPAGQTLAEHPGVDMIAFTGSLRVGRLIAEKAGATIKRVGLELGGKGPQVVFADADLDAAAAKIAGSIFDNCGQTCIAGSRLIVERPVADRLLDTLRRRAQSITVGDPFDERTNVGALISPLHLEKVETYVAAGVKAGAELVTGGNRLGTTGGLFYEPTIFAGAQPSMSIVRDEIFGPVLAVLPFDTAEEAVRMANDTIYGLSAGVWTRDIGRALRTIRGIRAGRTWINGFAEGGPEMPIGGYKQSGMGREIGQNGFDEYSEFKSVYMVLPEAAAASGPN
jgi:acyl-CoA reductase-like NAD-dependent aldehyde dehydrogenase